MLKKKTKMIELVNLNPEDFNNSKSYIGTFVNGIYFGVPEFCHSDIIITNFVGYVCFSPEICKTSLNRPHSKLSKHDAIVASALRKCASLGL